MQHCQTTYGNNVHGKKKCDWNLKGVVFLSSNFVLYINKTNDFLFECYNFIL
jgi:hypothetical protein